MAQRDEKEKELQVLLDLTPKKMWSSDLDAFEVQWQVRYDHKALMRL